MIRFAAWLLFPPPSLTIPNTQGFLEQVPDADPAAILKSFWVNAPPLPCPHPSRLGGAWQDARRT